MREELSLEEAFAYYAECALATVQGLPANFAAGRKRRLQSIADGMVDECERFSLRTYGNPRLARVLEARGVLKVYSSNP